MLAVHADRPGGPEVLTATETERPTPGPGEVLIRVLAAGLNRADTLQREGHYRVPAGATDILGLEVSGSVAALGEGVADDDRAPSVGEPVMALLASGGYAEFVSVPVGQVLPIPERIDPVHAAGIPEVAATVVSNLNLVGRFQPGETVLIHGATGGIGVFAIQLVHALGGKVAVTASSTAKLEQARLLGAQILINYREQDFAEVIAEHGGADIILDTVGGSYLERNVQALRRGGRIVTIAVQGGARGELDFGALMTKKASVSATTLRDRSVAEKTEIIDAVRRIVLPLLESGQVRPVTDSIYPLAEVAAAHAHFDTGTHLGKVLLDCRVGE